MTDNFTTASVARACQNCATAKAKCSGKTNNAQCERCARLKKDCIAQVPIRKQRPSKITGAARAALLEKKLDGIVSLLSATQQATLVSAGSVLTPASSDIRSPSASASTRSPDGLTYNGFGLPQMLKEGQPAERLPFHQVVSLPSFAAQSTFALSSTIDIGAGCGEADELLNLFRKHLAKQAPYVVIPADMTARDLLRQKPFLYSTIIMAASYCDIPRQVALGQEVMKYLSEHLLLRGEKTLDLLQGLLVYISWYQYHLHFSPQMNNLLQLLGSILVDLGLNKEFPSREKQDALINDFNRANESAPKRGPKTMDERRAVLGCYYLISCITSSFSKLDPMRYSLHIEQCCTAVSEAGEFQTDIILVHLTRLRYIVERIRLSGLYDEDHAMKAPVGMYVKSFQIELQNFKCSLPGDLQREARILMHYYVAEIQLYEVCFQMTSDSTHPLQRIEILYACLSATTSFFDAYLSIPTAYYFCLSMVNFGQLMHAVATISKLFLLDDENWDLGHIRGTVNLPLILEQMAGRMEEAAEAYGQVVDNSAWSLCARKMRRFMSWYEAKLASESASAVLAVGMMDGAGAGAGAEANEVLAENQFDLPNEDFWQDLSDNWDLVQ